MHRKLLSIAVTFQVIQKLDWSCSHQFTHINVILLCLKLLMHYCANDKKNKLETVYTVMTSHKSQLAFHHDNKKIVRARRS